MSDQRNCVIDALGAQGDGIARQGDGTRIFVPGALPGETWRRSDDDIFELIDAPARDRQEAACRHFDICGGCVAQHMSDTLYRDWKHQIVQDALSRVSLDSPVLPLWCAQTGTRRRATFHIIRQNRKIVLGFFESRGQSLFDMTMCPVLAPAITDALPVLRQIAVLLLPDSDAADVSATCVDGGLQVAFETKRPTRRLKSDVQTRLSRLAKSIRCLCLTINGDFVVSGNPATIQFGKATVGVSDGPFLQAVPGAETEMQRLVINSLRGAKSIADIFCGTGTFTFPLAEKARVAGYDNDQAAINALNTAARHTQGLKPVTAIRRDLFRHPLNFRELEGIDGIVINPPRAGARAQCEQLAASLTHRRGQWSRLRVVMVSCNPVTFARDARILVDGGYVMGSVTPIDQFLWSPHVELVAVFTRR